MRWFNSLQVSTKLLISGTISVLIIFFIGFSGLSGLGNSMDSQYELYNDRLIPIRDIAQVNDAILNIRLDIRNSLLTDNPSQRTGYANSSSDFFTSIDKKWESISKSKLDKDEVTLVTETRELFQKYKDVTGQIHNNLKNSKDLEAEQLIIGIGKDIGDKISENIKTLEKNKVNQADNLQKSTDEDNKSTQNAVLFYLIFGVAASIAGNLIVGQSVNRKFLWYEALLDSVKYPMSVTNRRGMWTFVNKAVEDLLKKKRKDLIGKKCNEWGAGICNTSNCGIERLRKGNSTTFFEQFGNFFKVDTSYILDRKGRNRGHVEFVIDMTELKKQTDLISESADTMLSVSEKVSVSALELQSSTSHAATSSEQISSNSNTVASAAEQMVASVREIAQNTMKASQISRDAAQKADYASEAMDKLNRSSAEVSSIVKVITSISEQTNLLALNATIEAARAGEAGKGFAVVANEVKELAKQAAKASEDITSNIQTAMKDTEHTIEVIREITVTIKDVNDIANTIASAVEEQSVTVNEINRNLNEVTKGSNSIAVVNSEIAQTAYQYSDMAEKVKTTAKQLTELSNKLNNNLTA